LPHEKLEHWVVEPKNLPQYTRDLEAVHVPRISLDRNCLRLTYERPQIAGYDFDSRGQLYRRSGQQAFYDIGPSLTREITGAAAANLSRQLMVKVVPSGADPDLYAKCEAASAAANGILEGAKYLIQTKQRAIMDALHCCLGIVKVYVDRATKELQVERVDPLSCLWPRDQGDRPFDFVELHQVPRRKALAEWASDAKAQAMIREAPTWHRPSIPGVEQSLGQSIQSDCIKIIEATSVTLGKEKGKKAFAVEGPNEGGGGILGEVEEYDEDVLPYAFVRYDWDFRGMEGISLARIVGPYDIRNRRLSRMMDEAIKGCVPVIWEHINDFAFEGLDDLAYQRGQYHGAKPPEIAIAGKTSIDVANELERNKQAAYAEGGISYEMGRGQLPPGLKSAPSINAYSETVSLRQLMQQQRTEQLDGDVGELICRFGPKSKAVRVSKGNDYLTEVKFPEIGKNRARVSVMTGSGLPLTLSGRIAAIEHVKTIKTDITDEQVGRLLYLPDIDALNTEAFAHQRLAEKIAGEALAEAKWPEYGIPQDPKLLSELLVKARSLMMIAMDKGTYDDKNLATLHRVIRVTESMVEPPPAPAPAASPAPPPGMGADPGMGMDAMGAPLPAPMVGAGEPVDPMAAPAPIPPIV
jgi:hypothetical protein